MFSFYRRFIYLMMSYQFYWHDRSVNTHRHNTQCWPMAHVFHYFVLKSRLRSVSTIRYMLTAYIAYMVCLNLSSLLGDNIGIHIIFCPVGKRYRGIVKPQSHWLLFWMPLWKVISYPHLKKIALCHLKTLLFCVFCRSIMPIQIEPTRF